MPDLPHTPDPAPSQRQLWRRAPAVALLWLWRALRVVAVLMLLLTMALQFESVQNFLCDKAEAYLSKALGAKVEVARVDIRFFDHLRLEGVHVSDQRGDTLLYSRLLDAQLRANPLMLLRRQMRIKTLLLEDAQLNIRRDSNELEHNAQFILDYFAGGKKQQAGEPFHLRLGRISLRRLAFRQQDALLGNDMSAFLAAADLRFDPRSDLAEGRLRAQQVYVRRPAFVFTKRPASAYAKSLKKPAQRSEADSSSRPLVLEVGHFQLEEGIFRFDNLSRAPISGPGMDYNHLAVTGLNMLFKDFRMAGLNFDARIEQFAAVERSGFVLENASAQAHVGPDGLQLYGLDLRTPYSQISDTLIMRYDGYPAFIRYNDEVTMEGHMAQSEVALRDIMIFAPALETVPFFRRNREERLRIDGSFKGKVNSLRVEDATLRLNGSTVLRGTFRSRNIAVRGEEFIDFEIEGLGTRLGTVKALFPNLALPPQFDRLDQLQFKGRFTGFFADFVANGYLRSNLGDVRSDLKLDLRQGRRLARYSGELDLLDFDMGTLLGVPDLGRLSLRSAIEEGKSLLLEDLSAQVRAEVDSVAYKGYTYRAFTVRGLFEDRFFDGDFRISDPFIGLHFNGKVNLKDSIPQVDVRGELDTLDLLALNLLPYPYLMSGDFDVNFVGNKPENLRGSAKILDATLSTGGEAYHLDSLLAESGFNEQGERALSLRSELGTATLSGNFNLEKVPAVVTTLLYRRNPALAARIGLRPDDSLSLSDKQFFFALAIHDSRNFTHLISPDFDTLRQVEAEGHYIGSHDSLSLELGLPYFGFGQVRLEDMAFYVRSNGPALELTGGVMSTRIGDSLSIPATSLLADLKADTVKFNLSALSVTDFVENLNLNGYLFLVDSLLQVSFLPSDLKLFDERWQIARNNYLRLGQGYIETNAFKLNNAWQEVALASTPDHRGLRLELKAIDLALLNRFLRYEPLTLGGKAYVDVLVRDAFAMKGFSASTLLDTFYINGDDWGTLTLRAEAATLRSAIEFHLDIAKSASQQLLVDGHYVPAFMAEHPKLANTFDTRIRAKGLPMQLAEYFIGSNISDTRGSIGAQLALKGSGERPDIGGWISIADAAITIDYLQTRYYVREDTVRVDNSLFDVSGTRLRDDYGNRATLRGGIKHRRLRDFELALEASAEQFLLINTEREDNELFYGQGIGRAYIRFSGPFSKTDIYINATTGPNTKIAIPISYGTETSDIKFIRFSNPDAQADDKTASTGSILTELKGLGLEIDLSVTPDAEIMLIFDQQAGDIIRGRGRGDMKLQITRDAEFKMYGDYTIERGEYLFTYLNLINKPFAVRPGGSIQWSGDPFDARIRLDAYYAGLNASPYNFIVEYLGTDAERLSAQQPTRIDLSMQLEGALMQPNIRFNIAFPDLRGPLQTYTDSKLRTIKEDPNELNRQVFGLIVVGGFLPVNSGLAGGNELAIGFNTLTEFLSNQLSLYLSSLLSEVFTDVGFVSGVDFDVNYRVYQNELLDAEQGTINSGDELELRLRNNFLNNRLSVNVGSNFDVDGRSTGQRGGILAGDIMVEYLITEDGRLKVRAYVEDELVIEGRRRRGGVGIAYSREFDSFGELFGRDEDEEDEDEEEDEDDIEVFGTFNEGMEALRKRLERAARQLRDAQPPPM